MPRARKCWARYWDGDIPWVSPKDVKSEVVADSLDHISIEAIENSATSLIPPGSILVVVRSGILARIVPLAITGRELTINQDLKALVPDARVDSRYLYYFLQEKMDFLLSRVTRGATVHRISTGDIKSLQIDIPPITEQQRIVAILDQAFEGIATAKANAERNLRNAKGVFDSYLQAVFSCRNENWKEIRLGDIVTRLTNGYVGPTRNIYQESGIPYLLARHVKNDVLAFDGKTFVSDAFNQKNKKSILKAGDVLLVQSGHIGHSAVVTPEHQGHNCHAMIVITPVNAMVSGDFLSLYFNSPEMRRRFDSIRSGSTVPHLTCGEVRELTIPVPDLATQRGVVARASALQAEVRRLVAAYEAKQSRLVDLKQSLLQHAFSGQL
jgi:type I restriction enzyme S subunit